MVPGVEIYRGRPNERLAVVFPRQEHGLWWPLVVIPCYGSAAVDCRWRTRSGVRPGSTISELEKINGRPFRLFPSYTQQVWTEPRWDKGALTRELGEDVELSIKGQDESFYNGPTYLASNEKPLNSGNRHITRMLVFLLSQRRVAPPNDWAIRGRFWSMLTSCSVEQLRETLGTRNVRRTTVQGEEGIGDLPAVSIFSGQANAEVTRTLDQDGTVFTCLDRDPCRWHIPGVPRRMTLAQAQKLNGRAFEFNGFEFDLGGIVTSWSGGRVPGILGKARFSVTCESGYPDRMRGDGVMLKSDDPGFASLKCTVSAISF